MKTMTRSSLAVIAIALSITRFVCAQQSSAADLAQLREQIRKLEAIAADPATPPAVREINIRNLERRRSRLNEVTRQEIAGLRDYQNRADFLDADEKKLIADRIQQLEKETQAVADPPTSSATKAASPKTPAQPPANDASTDPPTPPANLSQDEPPNGRPPLRAILGIEQVGNVSASATQRAFLDLYINSPMPSFSPLLQGLRRVIGLKNGKICTPKCSDGSTPKCSDDSTPICNDGSAPKRECKNNECDYSRVSMWGNIRFSSLPKQNINVMTGSDGMLAPITPFASSTISGLKEITRTSEFLIGPEIRLLNNNDVSINFIASGGAITPGLPQDSATFFKIPENITVSELKQYVGKTVAFVPPDRDRFLHQYFAGLRFKTEPDRSNGVAGGVFDITFGQSEALTDGHLRGVALRLEGFYPLPIRGNKQIFYLFGTAMMRLSRPHISDPIILEQVSPVPLSSVPIITAHSDRDFYRIGIGVDLLRMLMGGGDRKPSPNETGAQQNSSNQQSRNQTGTQQNSSNQERK